jgi:exodeoxyribonuclease VII large subunit
MQGDQAATSIIEALDKIYEYMDLFDIVVIIRGGGASTDMACFDSYDLAFNCAQFPLPIIAGIGHQRDLSIVDMVAHTSVKTPTATAEFLIDKMSSAKQQMTDAYTEIYQLLSRRVQQQQQLMTETRWKIRHALQNKTAVNKLQIERFKSRLNTAIKLIINNQQNKLTLLDKNIERHSPAFLLQYGYSITTINGKKIASIKAIKPGDKIHTYLSDGDFSSTVD